MKRTAALSFLLFVFSIFIFAQNRGIKPLTIKIQGKQVKLYDQSHALIIGNSIYTNGWNNLPGVKIDVYKVKAALEKNGFHVILKQNLTKTQTDKVFSDFIKTYGAGENNRLLFYYAGHGFTVKSKYGGEVGYIVPSDAPNPNKDKAGFQSKAVEMAQIEIYAERIDSKHALFLFDACFAGSLFAMRAAAPAVISYKTKEPVRQFITSGSADESVPDKSIFCQQLVIALTSKDADANNDGYLTGTELGKFLQDNVVNYSYNNQHPQYGKIRNQYLDKGDFVFILDNINTKKQNYNNQPEESGFVQGNVVYDYGSISIDSKIAGSFYLDGVYKGKIKANSTGNKLTKITIGTHTLKLEGDETWTKTISVYKDQTKYVTVKSNKTKDLPSYLNDSRDGKSYKIVKIGIQVWMVENLAFETASGSWTYDNNQSNIAKYGYLYNWRTAKTVCPSGWHLPSKLEFESLLSNFGGSSGYKANYTALIPSGNSGFSASFGGWRYGNGSYNYIGKGGFFWSSSAGDDPSAWTLYVYSNGKNASMVKFEKSVGLSVRCVQDN